MHRSTLLLALLAIGCTRENPGIITAQGTIEVEETDVVTTVGGRITRFWPVEGQMVRAGDTIATLQSYALPDDLREREARVSRAEAELADLLRGARPEEIARAEAQLRSDIASEALAAKDLERMEGLVLTNAVSHQDVDRARSAAVEARGDRETSEENLKLLKAGATREAIDAARSRLAEAKAALAQGRATSGELTLLAPVDGVVLPLFYKVGEVVAAEKPVITTADIARPWIRVYVNQKDVPSLKHGAAVRVQLDGAGEAPIAGQVVAINHAAEYTPRVALTVEERADLMFGVKIALDNSTGRARAGLPATVEISRDSSGTTRTVARVALSFPEGP